MKDQSLFGLVGRDVITGFKGVIIGYVQYMTGCSQFLLTPKVGEDNTLKDGQWYDTSRIEVVEEEARLELPTDEVTEVPGCDMAAPCK